MKFCGSQHPSSDKKTMDKKLVGLIKRVVMDNEVEGVMNVDQIGNYMPSLVSLANNITTNIKMYTSSNIYQARLTVKTTGNKMNTLSKGEKTLGESFAVVIH